MSSDTQVENTGSYAITNYDVSKIFVLDNRFQKGTYENTTGDEITLAAGTVMGRIANTGKLLPLESDAADGSQYPIGVLNQTITVADTDEVEVAYCVAGDVAEELLTFVNGYDDLDTVVSDRTLRDRMAADTEGIHLVTTDEMTENDNQ